MNPFVVWIYFSNVVHLPQNGLESLVVRYNGPRSFDCDAENPIFTQLESVQGYIYKNKLWEKTFVEAIYLYIMYPTSRLFGLIGSCMCIYVLHVTKSFENIFCKIIMSSPFTWKILQVFFFDCYHLLGTTIEDTTNHICMNRIEGVNPKNGPVCEKSQ